MASSLGICQWFHYEDRETVFQAITLLKELRIKHLRTGVFWADWHRPGGPDWYEWLLRTLHAQGLELLVSFWCTPPSLADLLPEEDWQTACARQLTHRPPRQRHIRYYEADLRHICERCGEYIFALELWNEPNNRYKWDFERFDPAWQRFADMIIPAAAVGTQFGKPVCLGGMSPCDPFWILNMQAKGVVSKVDAIGIHDFPGMWTDPATRHWATSFHWPGWAERIRSISTLAADHEIWITETGFATTHGSMAERKQCEFLERLAYDTPRSRAYWYSLIDLHPMREAVEGFHVDEDEYHMGLVSADGTKKPAFAVFQELLRR